ncbi:hypothetical protein [Ekhidna sp.]
MASKIDVSGLTINEEEAKDLGKAIFEAVLTTGEIEKYHEVHTGIEYDTQIAFIGTLGLVGKSISGCGVEGSSNTLPLTEKFWRPKRIGDRLEHCEADINNLFKLFKKKRAGSDFFNQVDSEELGVVMMRVADAIIQMFDRLAWFGDSAADTISGGGVYDNAYSSEMPYYTPLDGIWKQVFAETTLQEGGKYHVNIDVNEGGDYNAQNLGPDDLADGYARGIYKSMLNKRDARFKQAVNKGVEQVIHSTSALAENYVNWLEDQSLAFTLERAEDGKVTEIKYRNTTIIPRYDWDEHIAKQDDGSVINFPHRALLTTKENIPMGTPSQESLSEVKSFYAEYEEVNVMKFADLFDFKFLEDYMAVAAY